MSANRAAKAASAGQTAGGCANYASRAPTEAGEGGEGRGREKRECEDKPVYPGRCIAHCGQSMQFLIMDSRCGTRKNRARIAHAPHTISRLSGNDRPLMSRGTVQRIGSRNTRRLRCIPLMLKMTLWRVSPSAQHRPAHQADCPSQATWFITSCCTRLLSTT